MNRRASVGVVMRPVAGSPASPFGDDAVFCFDQVGDTVIARYGGGVLDRGLLTATADSSTRSSWTVEFLHLSAEGAPVSGRFHADLSRSADGRWSLTSVDVGGTGGRTPDPVPLRLVQS